MLPEDDQPLVHEIGNRTYLVAPVEPLDLDGIRTMQVGTAFWAIALVLLLPFYGRLEEDGHLWWLWTCVAGFGLGLVGWDHCRRRRKRRHEASRLSQMSTTRGVYYTATTLDGYIADEHDSLEWLFEQEGEDGGPAAYDEFIAGSAPWMGSTTTLGGDHLGAGERGPTTPLLGLPRDLEPAPTSVRVRRRRGHHAAIAESAGGGHLGLRRG